MVCGFGCCVEAYGLVVVVCEIVLVFLFRLCVDIVIYYFWGWRAGFESRVIVGVCWVCVCLCNIDFSEVLFWFFFWVFFLFDLVVLRLSSFL